MGASRGIGACRGVMGVLGVHWDGRWTGNLTTLGPSPGSHHFNWFLLGSDLTGQGQASDRNELCRLLYTFGTIFWYSLHICIYATYSHIHTHNVKKCYKDYVLSKPIYAYPYTINLMYYGTMVLITKNYFSHQTSELGTSDCKCQADISN